MQSSRPLITAVSIIAIALLVHSLRRGHPAVVSATAVPSVENFQKTEDVTTKASPAPEVVAAGVPSAQPKFSAQWLEQESHALNAIDPNPSQTLAKLQAIANSLTDADRDVLVQTATDPKAGQNQRILSVHLLTLNKAAPAEVFIKIASFDDPIYHAEAPAHSSAEFQSELVGALQLAALSEIQDRAATSPSLINELDRISERSVNHVVKDVSHRMAVAVRSGKTFVADIQ